jgi:molecular chaperone DnaK (HSP70)
MSPPRQRLPTVHYEKNNVENVHYADSSCKLNKTNQERHVIVHVFGGGTFHGLLLVSDTGMVQVLATAGDTHLSGEDLYGILLDDIVTITGVLKHQRVIASSAVQYHKGSGVHIMKNLKTIDKFKYENEKAKWTMSSQTSTRTEIKTFHNVKNFSTTLTRATIEELDIDLVRTPPLNGPNELR